MLDEQVLCLLIYDTFNTFYCRMFVIISYYIIIKNCDFIFDIHKVDQKRE